MKKVIIVGIVLIFLVSCLTLAGCGKTTGAKGVPDAPNAQVPCIIHRGVVYRITDEMIPDAEIDENTIMGEITSVVSGSELPTQNGEANFGKIGMPYALVSKGLAVRIDNAWRLFVQAD